MAEKLVLGEALLASPNTALHWNWGVVIDGSVIIAVGPNDELRAAHPDAEVIDASGLLLMPGFVNAHMHSYGLLAHGIPVKAPPSGFYEFLKDFWWPRVEDRLDHEMIAAAFRLACGTMIQSGFTSFCDILEAPHALPGALKMEQEVVAEGGLRGILSIEASERHGRELGEKAMAENAKFAERQAGDQLIRGMMCIHTSFTCSQGFVKRAKEIADELKCGIQLHLSESPYEPEACMQRYGLRPVQWYDQLGFWDGSVLASQGVALDPGEIKILAGRRVRLAHMPLSNCEVGGGVAPVPDMIARGMRPGLGTDGYLNDPFEVMRGAFLIHKGARHDPGVMPAKTVFAMATAWGAEAIGIPKTGKLAPGMFADLIGVDISFATPLTADNVFDQVILFRSGSDVRLSIVNGTLLMRNGELLTVEIERARRGAAAQAQRLWEME